MLGSLGIRHSAIASGAWGASGLYFILPICRKGVLERDLAGRFSVGGSSFIFYALNSA